MKTIEDIAMEVGRAERQLMEERIRDTMMIAGVELADIREGRALWARITSNHPDCRGSGIVRTIEPSRVTVELCSCLEIRIIKPI